MDSYDLIVRFPTSEQGRWLRGLLKNAGHASFRISGPWTHEGTKPGSFSDPLRTFSLFLVLDGSPLAVEFEGQQRRVTDRDALQRLMPLPVAQQVASDLGGTKVLSSVRKALEETKNVPLS
ncbi:MAG: hypothetical protein K1X89_24325 [Myxococcaceae bacterium]|nr:hypothetical protein [Myxococcaceae bacterium]